MVEDVSNDCIGAVELLTESSETNDVLPSASSRKRAAKRKRSAPRKKRDDLADPVALRRLLSKKCHQKCRRGCFTFFQDREPFQKLQTFPKEWKDLHKLDQDQIAPGLAVSVCID